MSYADSTDTSMRESMTLWSRIAGTIASGLLERLETLHTRKFFRDDGDHLNIGIVLFKALANARDGSSGADPTDKMGELPPVCSRISTAVP